MTHDETARLAALHRHHVLDTPPEEAFDDLTALAALICGTPISLITLVDTDRQWFKSRQGLPLDETARSVAFCSHAIEQRGLFIVSDAQADERFRGNPLVTGPPHIRFYAGAPLVTEDGHALGTLCVIDRVARTLTPEQLDALTRLTRQAEAQLELRLRLVDVRTLAARLGEQSARLNALLATGRLGTWEWDFQTSQGHWSDTMYRLLGMTPGSTPPGMDTLLARVHPDDRERLAGKWQSSLDKRTAFEGGDYRVLAPEGAVRWIREVGSVECDAEGRPLRISGIVEDVTNRRVSEQALIDAWQRAEQHSTAQARLAGVLAEATTLEEAAPRIIEAICEPFDFEIGGLWMADPASGMLRCVETWSRPTFDGGAFEDDTRRLALAPGDGLPGRVWKTQRFACIPDVSVDDNSPRRAAAAQAGLRTGLAVPLVSGEASSGVLEFFSRQVLEFDRDTLTMFEGLGVQIGQFVKRVHAEEEIRRSEDRFRRLLGSALDAVISMNGRGLVTLWTPQAEAMFGWTADEATGQRLGDLIVPAHMRDAHERGLRRYVTGGEGPVLNRRLELTACRKDGREFPIEISIAATHPWTPSAAPDEMLFGAFVRDTSDRLRAEAELRRAKEEAEAAARAKSEFLAVMSHEVRTPLNGVMGMLNQVLEMSPSAEQRDALLVAQSSADTLLAITNDILDFSRMSAGRLTLEESAFDLGRLIEQVAAALRPQAKPARVALHVRFPGGRPGGVMGDQGRVRQILYNLVGNALKFTEEGSVEITATARPGPDGVVAHRIVVEDTGIGIPADKQSAIFEAFTQADASTTSRFGGYGLGLSICAQLAALMSGTVRLVRSSPAGSVFELVVPLRPAAAVPERIDPARPPRRFRGRVLLVEDNPVLQKISTGMLRRSGCSVDLAGNGAEAVEMVRRFRYDLILMDCRMPEMDGYEATRIIRGLGLDTTDALPIVAMTAGVLPQDRQRCLDAGMTDHVGKPVLQATLEEVLAQWLEELPEAVADPVRAGIEDERRPMADLERIRATRLLFSEAGEGGWNALCLAFTEQGQTAVDRMSTLVADQDVEALAELAHGLKGSAGVIGAGRLARLCAQLEETGAAAGPAARLALTAAVRDEFTRIAAWLEAGGA